MINFGEDGRMLPIIHHDDVRVAENRVVPNDIRYAQAVGEALDKHYPGHPWLVEANCEQGVITIRNLGLGMRYRKYGFRIHIPKCNGIPDMQREAVKMGGELLERARMDRAGFKADQYQDVIFDTVR